MASCSHVQWLRLSQEHKTFSLQDGHRLHSITQSLPRPSKQYPSFLFFLGKGSKSVALRNLFPETRISSYRHYGIANICLDPKTSDDDYPLIIADGCQSGATYVTNSTPEYKCHETTNHLLDWPESENEPPQQQSIIDITNARLLSLFIDVICIFAEDYGGLADVVTQLTNWAAYGSASSLHLTVRPRIVVVTRIPGNVFESEVLHFRSQLFSTPKFSEVFSSLNVVNLLAKLRPNSQTQFGALKEVLGQELQTARFARISSSAMFSCIHLKAFFGKAVQRFVQRPEARFDFLRASRDENPVNPELPDHIDTFMSFSRDHKFPDGIPVPFVASAILLDSFPPDMHRGYCLIRYTIQANLSKILTLYGFSRLYISHSYWTDFNQRNSN